MSYVKTSWRSGDVITAQKLNNLENGVEDISGEVLPPLEYASENDLLVVNGTGEASGESINEIDAFDGRLLPLTDSSGYYLKSGYDGSYSGECLDDRLVPSPTGVSEGDVVMYNGSDLVGGSVMPETDYANAGDALVYNGSGFEWSTIIPSCSTGGSILMCDGDGGCEGIPASSTSGCILLGDGVTYSWLIPSSTENSALVSDGHGGYEGTQLPNIPAYSNSDSSSLLHINVDGEAEGLQFPDYNSSLAGYVLGIDSYGNLAGINPNQPQQGDGEDITL